MEKLLLKPMEVAELLSVGRTRVYEMLACGILPSVRIGRSVRIPVFELKEWVENIGGKRSLDGTGSTSGVNQNSRANNREYERLLNGGGTENEK